MSANKLKCDSGLLAALQSFNKDDKFKIVQVFALRSIAEYCTPPNANFLQNSLAVIEGNSLAAICRIASSSADADVAALCVKCLWGISQLLLTTTNSTEAAEASTGSDGKQLLKGKAVAAEEISKSLCICVKTLAKSAEYEILELGFDALINCYESGVALDGKVRRGCDEICWFRGGIMRFIDTLLEPQMQI